MELVKSEINGYFCPDDPGEPESNEQRLSVNDLEARLISEFASGKVVLEIGTGLGVSTKALAKTAKKVVTVDIDPWVAENVELPDGVEFKNSTKGLKKGYFDMAFIDACHLEEYVKKDIAICRHLVRKGGLLLFHDTSMLSVRYGIAASGLPVYAVSFGTGIGFGWND